MSTLQIVLLFLCVAYGVVFGLGNTYYRVMSMFPNKTLLQNDLGRGLDVLWYTALLYLAYIQWCPA